MFEGLIGLSSERCSSLVNKITTDERRRNEAALKTILSSLLGFAEKNPGHDARAGRDALVNEDRAAAGRINQLPR